MTVVLGSGSVQLMAIVQKALGQDFAFWQVEQVKVGEDRPYQLLDSEAIAQQATEVAKQALNLRPGARLAVGLASGLEDVGGILNLVCVAAFWDGQQLTVGQSGHLPLPLAVSDQVKRGGQAKLLLSDYQRTAPGDEQERLAQLLSRELSFSSAVSQASPLLKQRYGSPYLAFSGIFTPHFGLIIIKVAAMVAGFCFSLGAILVFLSGLFGRNDVYSFVSWLIPVFFGFWLIGLYFVSRLVLFQSQPDVHRAFLFTNVLSLPSWFILTLFTWLSLISDYDSLVGIMFRLWLSVWLVIAGILAILTIWSYLNLLGQLIRKGYITTATKVFLLIGLGTIILNAVTMVLMSMPVVLISPLALAGLCWPVGLWRFSQELRAVVSD